MGYDPSRYLALFVGEATEHLEALTRDLVSLESQPSPDVIAAMFRHAHSVKGMAASMGFDSIATVSHRLEDLLDVVRSKPSVLDKAFTDDLLAGTDALLRQVRHAGANEPFEDLSPLLQTLGQRVAALTGAAPKRTVVAQAQAATPERTVAPPSAYARRFMLRLRVDPASATPGVRAFLAYKRLGTLGDLSSLSPPLEELKAGRLVDSAFSFELSTNSDEDALRATLATITEVSLDQLVFTDTAPKPVVAEPTVTAETPRVVGAEHARSVRIRTELLDEFLDTAGELLLAVARVREVVKGLSGEGRSLLEEPVGHLGTLSKHLHDRVMQARMTPVSVLTDRLPRAARDIARRRNREVELVIAGADIELDRAILDELAEPVLHVLRNAIDHGLEDDTIRKAAGKPIKGRLDVGVRRDRDRVILEIADDGAGMDVERLKSVAISRGLLTTEQAAGLSRRDALLLCCVPGLSTRTDVTDISGRGVGMDAVKRAVEDVGGTLDIESTEGKGTRVRLVLPLTVAVVNLLLVESQGEIFGLPIHKVSGVVTPPEEAFSRSGQATLLAWESLLLPVKALSNLLRNDDERRVGAGVSCVVVETDGQQVVLVVDRLLGQSESVLKPLPHPLDLLVGLSGVTVLGDGQPVFILDVPRLWGGGASGQLSTSASS